MMYVGFEPVALLLEIIGFEGCEVTLHLGVQARLAL